MTHIDLKKSCLSNRPTKMAQQGLVCEQGVFPYSGGESLTQAHTGGTAGTIRLCCLLVFGISSFSGPIPKVLFFVYAAQFLYRRLHHSIPLIMFHRTLLGGMKTFSFASRLRNKMHFLKPPQNCSKHRVTWHQVLFPYLDQESPTQATQSVTLGVPAWLSYLMLSSSVHPKILSPSVAGRIAPLLPGSDGW